MRSSIFSITIGSLLLLTFMTSAAQKPAENAKILQALVSSNLVTVSLDIPEDERLNKPDENTLRVGSKPHVRVILKNDSDQRITARVADRFYQNRPQLFISGKLVPYREKLEESLQRQELFPGFVTLRHVVLVSAYSSEKLTEIDLDDWYGELEPGMYRLISRYRLDVQGPWTADSGPLSFEVVSK